MPKFTYEVHATYREETTKTGEWPQVYTETTPREAARTFSRLSKDDRVLRCELRRIEVLAIDYKPTGEKKKALVCTG